MDSNLVTFGHYLLDVCVKLGGSGWAMLVGGGFVTSHLTRIHSCVHMIWCSCVLPTCMLSFMNIAYVVVEFLLALCNEL
jgi:hypothetical protein